MECPLHVSSLLHFFACAPHFLKRCYGFLNLQYHSIYILQQITKYLEIPYITVVQYFCKTFALAASQHLCSRPRQKYFFGLGKISFFLALGRF